MENEKEILRRLEDIKRIATKLSSDRLCTRDLTETWKWIICDLGDDLINIRVEADVIGFLIKGENK